MKRHFRVSDMDTDPFRKDKPLLLVRNTEPKEKPCERTEKERRED
jgi:hypothetical protein